MTHYPSAVLSPPAAHPVVVVCYTAPGSNIRPCDPVFRVGGRNKILTVTEVPPENGSAAFVGFAMDPPMGPATGKQVTVGVAGVFSTHADPTHLDKLLPGDYLSLQKPGNVHVTIADHLQSYTPPAYTVAWTGHAPIRMLHRETASTMRVQITVGHCRVPGVFRNTGVSANGGVDVVTRQFNAAFGNGSFNTTTACRAFVKMRGWTPNEMIVGPGFVDKDNKRTGVFTFISPKLTQLMGREVPFLLCVGEPNNATPGVVGIDKYPSVYLINADTSTAPTAYEHQMHGTTVAGKPLEPLKTRAEAQAHLNHHQGNFVRPLSIWGLGGDISIDKNKTPIGLLKAVPKTAPGWQIDPLYRSAAADERMRDLQKTRFKSMDAWVTSIMTDYSGIQGTNTNINVRGKLLQNATTFTEIVV